MMSVAVTGVVVVMVVATTVMITSTTVFRLSRPARVHRLGDESRQKVDGCIDFLVHFASFLLLRVFSSVFYYFDFSFSGVA